MDDMREQYERETGNDSRPCLLGELFVHTDHFVAWLCRRAACAEKLAAAMTELRKIIENGEVRKNPEFMSDLHLALCTALAEYEAACKGEG